MKKIVCLISSIVLLMLSCITASAAGSAALNGNASVTVDSTIELTVNVSGCGDASSVAVDVKCDGGFEVVSGTWLKGGSLQNFDLAKGKGALGGLTSPDVNGNLFKLVLKGKTASATAQNVSVSVIAKNGANEIMNIKPTKSVKIVCKTHSFGNYSKKDNNSHTRTCSVCGEVETSAHSWNGGSVTKAASCKETGVKTYTCTACDATKTEVIAKTNNHTYSGWKQTKAPSCTAKGTETRTCSTCQKTESRDVAATGHNMGGWKTTKEATCEAKGTETRSCSKCSHTETKELAALGHKFANPTVTKKPTCTETGTESGKCTRCGKETTNTIKATGHKIGESATVKEPTCTEEGLKEGTCTVCGAKTQEAIAAKGHSYGEAVVTKEATETETGIKKATCTVCGETKEEEIPCLTAEVGTEDPDGDDGEKAPVTLDKGNEKGNGKKTAAIIISVAAVVLAGGAAGAVVFIKKRR